MPRLTKRGGIWYTWVPKPGGGTRRVSTNCSDRKAAEKRAAQLEREAVDPAHAAANAATTQSVADEYLRSRERRGRSKETLRFYRPKLGHLVRLLPERLADVTAYQVERFISTRIAEGAAQTTVKKELRALGAMLKHAKRTGEFLADVDAIIPEYEDDYKPRTRALDPWELVALCNRLESARAAHVVFICMTGARWGESVRARREDVDFTNWTVRLRGTKTRRAARVVPIPPPLRTGLVWALRLAPGDALLFDKWGNVRRDLAVAAEHLGMGTATPNDLRRSVASWLRAWGVSTDLIAKYLGHTTSRMAERVYGQLSTPELAKLLDERAPAGLLMDTSSAESSNLQPSPENDKP